MVKLMLKSNVDGDKEYHYEFSGLSTDSKPTEFKGEDVEVNSLFLELDTGDFYYFDGSSWNKVGA